MGDDKQSLNFHFIFGIIGIFLAYKIFEIVKSWTQSPSNFYKFILIASLAVITASFLLCEKYQKIIAKKKFDKSILGPDEKKKAEPDAVYCGISSDGEDVWIKTRQRTMHTQVIGTTNAGKTESVIIPWAVQDIHNKRGLLIIDGKADNALLDKLWSYTIKANREKDFKLFSLGRIEESFQFNPLIGGTAEEITERVFNAFDFENPYYRSLQYEVMNQVMRVFEATQTVPTFQRLHQAISRPDILEDLVEKLPDEGLKQWILHFKSLSNSERETRTSGLLTAFGHFAFGAPSKLFNADKGAITIDQALSENEIVYFQLPVLLSPFLGKATGKLVLQSLQAAVANRHRSQKSEKKFFSVFLDDFSEYLYPGFVSILNKSRSANVGIVFAHQALGDIQELGEPVANSILTNSNLKVFMRGNDPDSAEYFSKAIGTQTSTKFTERQKIGLFNKQKTGDVSARDVEEFVIHPNSFKRDLGVGEAIMIVPHEKGSKTVKIKFNKIDDLAPNPIPLVHKQTLKLLEAKSIPKGKQETKSKKEEPLEESN